MLQEPLSRSRGNRHLRFDGAAPGFVTINSSGPISLSSSPFQASVNAPGAPVTIHGRSVSLTGDVNSAGADATIPSGGLVDIAATGGAADVSAGTSTQVAVTTRPGTARTVTLRGDDVRVGRIDASAGASTTGRARPRRVA